MKKYLKEIIIICIQLIIFYILPLFSGPTDAMGLVFLIIIITSITSTLLGIISKEKIKYLYPLIITISFIPTVFIYYNSSALIHAVWYFTISFIGLMIGNLIQKIINKYGKLIKKYNFKIMVIIIVLLIILGLLTSYIDSARVRNSIEPRFTIKVINEEGNKVTYWGLGYKIIRYVKVSPYEPYKNNRGIKYGSWFMKYELNKTDDLDILYEKTDIENVTTNISNISLTGATIKIKDTNYQPYTYGQWYKIEKQINGNWIELKTLKEDYGFNEIGYLPDKNNEVIFDINWETLYGKLSQGNYRILKQVNNQYIYIEFNIANTSKSKIEITKSKNTNSNKFNKYVEIDNRTIYLASNIEEIYFIEFDLKSTLKNYLTMTYQTFEDSINHITKIIDQYGMLKDGGTTIYKSSEFDMTLVKCKTIKGNKDIFIGDYQMSFDSNIMCK